MKHIVANFLSCILTEEEMTPLTCELDNHVPTNNNKNAIFTEFEQFFQKKFEKNLSLLRDISHMPKNQQHRIKTKLRSACEKYSKVRVPYKYREIASKLSKRKDKNFLKKA